MNIKNGANSNTGKSDDGSAAISHRRLDVDKSGSYRKINERFIRKACKKSLNGQPQSRVNLLFMLFSPLTCVCVRDKLKGIVDEKFMP